MHAVAVAGGSGAAVGCGLMRLSRMKWEAEKAMPELSGGVRLRGGENNEGLHTATHKYMYTHRHIGINTDKIQSMHKTRKVRIIAR